MATRSPSRTMTPSITSLEIKSVGVELARAMSRDKTPWYKKRHLLLLNFSILSMCLFSSANGYDGSMLNGLQSLGQWQAFMNYPKGSWLGFINAVQSLSGFVAYPLIAWFNNRYGRKPGIAIGYLWMIVAVALQSAAQKPWQFVLARAFLGQTQAWWSVTAPIWITEIAYPTHRATLTSLFSCGWGVGSLIAAWVTFGTRNIKSDLAWKIPSALQGLIPVFILVGYVLSPESPRWLISQGRDDEARRILTKYHAGGDENSLLVEFEMKEISKTLRYEHQAKVNSSYLDMVKTKGHRLRFLITVSFGIFCQWNGVGVAAYYLGPVLQTIGITTPTSQTLINACMQIWNLFIAVGASLCVDKLGRRVLFIVSCSIMLVSYICISGLSGGFAHTGSAAIGRAVVPFLFIFYGGYNIAFVPLMATYPAEIWPYKVRARGMSVFYASTSIALFFNVWVNAIALSEIGWKYYIVFAVILVINLAMCYFFYPETRGHSLEEIARVFDKDDGPNFEGAAEKHSLNSDGSYNRSKIREVKEVREIVAGDA